MPADAFFLLAGGCLLLAVLLPAALRSYAVSPPLVLLVVGVALGWTPLADDLQLDLDADRALVEHVTELTVLIALMGVGLALDRPLDLLRPASWRAWSPTWRLLGIAMPLCILGVALLGWALGLPLAAALVLGSVLAPTDPVLASDVQVGGPGSSIPDEAAADLPYAEDPTVSSESGEVRFALTSEAGLNDGLTFPFVQAAVLVAAGGSVLGGVRRGRTPRARIPDTGRITNSSTTPTSTPRQSRWSSTPPEISMPRSSSTRSVKSRSRRSTTSCMARW